MKCYVAILFGLVVIWTGLLRSVEAQEFKPNAFWFCLVMGCTAIAAGYCFRLGRPKIGLGIAALAGVVVLAFYLRCLMVQPEKDANLRVATAILASIAELALVLLPEKSNAANEMHVATSLRK